MAWNRMSMSNKHRSMPLWIKTIVLYPQRSRSRMVISKFQPRSGRSSRHFATTVRRIASCSVGCFFGDQCKSLHPGTATIQGQSSPPPSSGSSAGVAVQEQPWRQAHSYLTLLQSGKLRRQLRFSLFGKDGHKCLGIQSSRSHWATVAGGLCWRRRRHGGYATARHSSSPAH